MVERKNRTIQEMERTMLKGAKLYDIFWKEVVHILNKGFLRKNSDKTPDELWKGRPSSVNTSGSLVANGTSK